MYINYSPCYLTFFNFFIILLIIRNCKGNFRMPEKKEAVFVICEYNPFHFGHMHQLSELKKSYESVICIMSGDFVQRGETAVYPKNAGADAVFELAFPFSCMAARDFAAAGVYLAAALGCRHLAFGAEDGGDALLAA